MDKKLIPKIDFNEYSKDKYLLDLGNYEIKEEDGKIFAVLKKSKYPKTYEECCLQIKVRNSFLMRNYMPSETYKIGLIDSFQKLLICRDAYWKLADNWKPNWNDMIQPKFGIHTIKNQIKHTTLYVLKNLILVFPTEEMRDAFYKNFKDLIEKCKELL